MSLIREQIHIKYICEKAHELFRLKSKEYSFIDVNTIESKRLYEKEESVVETYFIAMYVDTIENNQSTVENKQKALDKCITKIVWAVIFVASAALVNKIIGGI